MTTPRHIKRRRVECPQCGTVQTVTTRPNIRRFKPRVFGCNECPFVGPLGKWNSPAGW